jgi:hypothetical protein
LTATLTNVGYWLADGLPDEAVAMLRKLQRGSVPASVSQHQPDQKLEIAYLIARECLAFDGQSVSITPKGEDALLFYSEE